MNGSVDDLVHGAVAASHEDQVRSALNAFPRDCGAGARACCGQGLDEVSGRGENTRRAGDEILRPAPQSARVGIVDDEGFTISQYPIIEKR